MDIPSRNVSHGDVPFQKRWELLRAVITQLYVDEDKKLEDVVSDMKRDHGFDAGQDQYKYHFRRWGIMKNLRTEKKRKLLEKAKERADAGKRTAFSVGNKPVDAKRLLRQVKTDSKAMGALEPMASGQMAIQHILPGFWLQFGPSIFMAWNRPHGIINPHQILEMNHRSPFGQAVSTPSDITASTPPMANASSPLSAPSPLSKALTMQLSIDRAKLFVKGNFDDLIKSMDRKEAAVMSSWLYQFWFFAFQTAKHWGGNWSESPSSLDIREVRSPRTLDVIELDDIPGNMAQPQYGEYRAGAVEKHQTHPQPSPLCRWSIHYECSIGYEEIPEQETFPGQEPPSQPPFQETLVSALERNDFASVEPSELPVAVPQIVKAAVNSSDVLLREALGFAIMGRNVNLIGQLCYRFMREKVEIGDLYPFHLAASFLDGATSCCNVFGVLIGSELEFPIARDLRELYVNNLGHTVLDSLMISILKSHTSTTPDVVDEELRHQKRFAGEEVDVCGRWDADSECFRALLSSGEGRVPMSWKHKFCHTSIQAICHCIILIDYSMFGELLSRPSGIFLKHCSCCGLKMQLQPLHALVVTAFQLASYGCADEDLFGILACLLTLLHCEIDPAAKANVSAELLFGISNGVDCTHERLTPAELADHVPARCTESWSEQTRTGWDIFRQVLRIAESDTNEPSDLENRDSEDDDGNAAPMECRGCYRHPTAFRGQPILRNLYAAVQTELLTYRRLQEGDSWVSDNFDLVAVIQSLQKRDKLLSSIGFVQKKLLNPVCECGGFLRRRYGLVSSEDACVHYFSNMDDWSRTRFIVFPDVYIDD